MLNGTEHTNETSHSGEELTPWMTALFLLAATRNAERDDMRISPRRLPRLLGTLVLAFGQFERRPLLGVARLFPGMAIQLAYRWATARVIAGSNDKAVLLWSVAAPQKAGGRWPYREFVGVLVAILVGLSVVTVNCAVLLFPLGLILVAADVSEHLIADAVLAIIVARFLLIGWRAIHSYRNELALTAQLPPASTPRWRIDFLAAVPARSGAGGRLLVEFLRQADRCDAEVVLHCERRNVAFYRKYGFQLLRVAHPGDQDLMLRQTRSANTTSDGHARQASRRSVRQNAGR